MAVFLVDRMLVWSCRCSPPLQAYVGHCGIIYSPSYLAGSSSSWWNQEEADSVISHQLLASSSPYGRLDASDSLSSTTSLQLRFNCWPNTRFLLFLHDLYTGSPSPPMHYKQEAHSTYIKPARWEFPLPAKLVGVLRESIGIIREIYLVSSWSFWCKKQSKRRRLRPFLLTSC